MSDIFAIQIADITRLHTGADRLIDGAKKRFADILRTDAFANCNVIATENEGRLSDVETELPEKGRGICESIDGTGGLLRRSRGCYAGESGMHRVLLEEQPGSLWCRESLHTSSEEETDMGQSGGSSESIQGDSSGEGRRLRSSSDRTEREKGFSDTTTDERNEWFCGGKRQKTEIGRIERGRDRSKGSGSEDEETEI